LRYIIINAHKAFALLIQTSLKSEQNMFGLTSNHAATGTASILIDTPVDQVFSFIAVDFFANYPRWSPEVQELELLSKPPLQLNSLVRQVRIDNGQRSESTFKITTYKVNEELVFEGVSNAYRCSYETLLLQTRR
jgi:hypothetical protein